MGVRIVWCKKGMRIVWVHPSYILDMKMNVIMLSLSNDSIIRDDVRF